jgi:transposase-like protein
MSDKRKKHAAGFKAKVALDALRERESVREISTRHGVHSTQVSLWKTQLRDAAAGIFEHPACKPGKLPDREAELFEQIGRLKMELEWLKKKIPDIGG